MGAKVNPVSYVEQWKIDKAKRKAAEQAEQAEQQKAAEQKAEKPAKKSKGDEE